LLPVSHRKKKKYLYERVQEPIQRLLNLQLQRQRCTYKAGAFFKVEENIFILNTRHAISCAVNFYNTGVVTRDRRIGSRLERTYVIEI
jgi:hypothetical protein